VKQIVSFGVAALYSGMWCLRWARGGGLESAGGQLGLLSGMVCVGSIVGIVAWAAFLQRHSLFYDANVRGGVIPQQGYTLYASSFRFVAVFAMLNGVEFLFFIICKLMLLGRLAANAAQSSQTEVTGMRGVRRRWLSGSALPNLYRVMAGSVVAGGVVSMVAAIVAGVYDAQSALLADQAAAACDAAGNDTNSSRALYNDSQSIRNRARTASSVQAGSEALALLLVSVAFLVIVSWSVALFRLMERVAARALLSDNDGGNMHAPEVNAARIVADTMQAAAEHRKRLTAACVIVLITFPVRAAYDLLKAYANFNDPFNSACGPCDSCQSTPFLIRNWIDHTPEFRPIVVAVSSPLPLTLSLWLLTKVVARARLIAANVEQACAGDGL
jgi:hypothetical protein